MRPGRGTEEEDPLLLKTDAPCGTRNSSLAERVYQFMEKPSSSTMAQVVSYGIVICIMISTALFITETVPSIESNQLAVLWFYAFECVFVMIFSAEYFVRLWSIVVTGRQSFCKFVLAPMNVIDLLAVLPWYVDLCMMLAGAGKTAIDLRALRTCRLVRMFKLGRYAPQLRTIGSAMERSVASLIMLLFMMSFALVTFSTLIWLVERGIWDEKQGCYARDIPEHDCSPFDSIPGSSWWAITTMTTVGYGDVFPKTEAGRIVGSFCMVVGILAVAMPTTVLSVQFADAYEEVVREEKEKVLRKAEEDDIKKHDTRQNALAHGLIKMEQLESKLALTMMEIENKLLKVTSAAPRRQASINASFGPMTAGALQAMVNSRRFLESYQG